MHADAPYPMAGMAHYTAGHNLPVPYGYFPQGVPHTQAAGSPTLVRAPLTLSKVTGCGSWAHTAFTVIQDGMLWLIFMAFMRYLCRAGAELPCTVC